MIPGSFKKYLSNSHDHSNKKSFLILKSLTIVPIKSVSAFFTKYHFRYFDINQQISKKLEKMFSYKASISMAFEFLSTALGYSLGSIPLFRTVFALSGETGSVLLSQYFSPSIMQIAPYHRLFCEYKICTNPRAGF